MLFNQVACKLTRREIVSILVSGDARENSRYIKEFCMALLCGLLCWSFAVNAKEESTPKQWLEKMSSAMQELNYEGVFIYLEGGELAAMRVIHVVDEKGAHELLQTLTGEERKELRNTPVGSAAKT